MQDYRADADIDEQTEVDIQEIVQKLLKESLHHENSILVLESEWRQFVWSARSFFAFQSVQVWIFFLSFLCIHFHEIIY